MIAGEKKRQLPSPRPLRLMFQDEARFGRISDPRRGWAPPGLRPEAPAQIVREYLDAFAAVSPHDGVLDSLVLPEVNAEMMSLFLREVSSRHPDEWILMFLDQAGWHIAHRLEVPTNISLRRLPPYSPQCNPVEHLWEEIREKWFPNRVFRDLDAVENVWVEALADLESDPKRIQHLTGFDWIVSIPMNAT